MKAESIVLTVAGMCFGVLLGWVLATLNDSRTTPAPIAAAAPPASPSAGNERAPAQLDEGQVQALTAIIKSDPDNAEAAEQLGETYFRADRMEEAAKWYGEAVRLDPKNIDASTQLGMSLFFTQGADPALAQFDKSLKLNPNHPRTLLSKGVVLWQGKRDLDGAAAAWRKIVDVAPGTQEAQAARQGLQALTGEAAAGAAPAAEDPHPATNP
jgi:cytochrome c-type biogenesis protein CcmH/NrfG